MKVAAILVVCAISLAQGKDVQLNENGCPIDYSIERLYPHENCNKFYQCTHGKLVEKICASDLFFSVEKQKCDWRNEVDCGDRVIPEQEPGGNEDDCDENTGGDNNNNCNCNPEDAPSICAKEDSEGVLIAHEKCYQFYKCNNGKPVATKCPDNLFYNPYKQVCDWPENIECGDRVIPDPDENDTGDGDGGNGDCDNGDGGNGDGGNGDGENGDGGNGDEGDGGTCNCNPGEAPTICSQDGSNGVLIAHENCNKFYICSNGKPVAMRCPGNLLYNPYKQVCDGPENVQCGDRVIPDPDENDTGGGDGGNGDGGNGDGGNGDGGIGDGGDGSTCNCNPGEAPTICAQDGSDGVLIAHENCNKFYICSNGKPVAMRCPGNLLYNPYKQVCDWPENVECGDRIIPDPDENDTGDGDCSGDGGNGDGGNGDGGNEDGGNGDGGNGDGGDGGTCNCNPGEAPTICAQDGSDGVLIAHENCNKFYICSNEKPVAMRCPGNLLYNPYKQVCDWPENVECGDRIIPDPDENDTGSGGGGNEDGGSGDGGSGDGGNGDGGNGDGGNGDGGDGDGGDGGTCNCNPGEAPTICAQDGSNGVLVAHENCNKFYICSNGKPVAMRCPGNLLYNPYKQVCDWPENVECGDRIIPDPDENDTGSGGGGNGDGGSGDGGSGDGGNGDGGNGDGGNGDGGNGDGGDGDGGDGGTCNCNPGEAPQICAHDGSDGVLIAHENCNKFYICSNGKPVAMRCPGNLLYNPYKQVCDWPENVECGDRIIPDPDENDTGSGGGGNGDGGSGDGGSGDGGNGDGGNGDGGNGDGGNGDGGDGGTCNCNPGEAPTICAQDGSDGVLIAHENCNKFYICSNGKPVAMRCPGNLLYNPYKQVCDWPENVECGDRIIPDPDENDTGSGGGGNGDGGSGDGGSGDGGNGDGGNGDGGSGDGGNGDGGNGDGGNGDGGDGGTCNCNPGEAPTICAQDGSDGVLIAHENCNKFYICSNGKPVAMRCPGNLLYNPYKQVCDWPENVECGDRIIPDPDENDTGSGGGGNGDGGSGDGGSGDGGNGDGGNGDGGNGDGGDGDGGDGGTCNCNPGEAPTICAQDGSNGVLVAHENCNKFYICSNGKPVAMRCPGNLLYNPYKQVCDWPENVECGDRIIPDPDENDTGSGGGGNGDGGSGDGGSGDGGNGDGGNGDGGNGDGGNGDGGDGDGGDGGTCNCNPGEAPQICAHDGSDGVLIAHENCNKFYICSNGKPVAMRCPGNLLYNPYKQVCDWPENVECGDRIIPDPDENDTGSGGGGNGDGGSGDGGSGDGGNGDGGNGDGGNGDGGNGDGGDGGTCNCNSGEAPTICAQDGSDGVLIAHENCNKFYICSNGKPVAMRCPGNLLYNPYKQVCDWPENVECGDRIIPDPDENDTGSGGGGNGDGGSGDGGSGDGGNGDGGNGDGGSGDGGNGDGGNGDGGNGDGGDGGTCNCNPGEAPTICAQDGSDGVLIAHENCNKFYICSNGKPVAMRCPGNLLYNPYKQVCDWPENVECGDRIIPDPDENDTGSGGGGNGDGGSGDGGSGDGGNGDGGNGDGGNGDGGNGDGGDGDGGDGGTCNCNPGEAPQICAQDGSDGVLIAHENCNKFYICSNGKPVAMRCPGNLLYNPYKQVCDWPENVECGDRIIPDPNENDTGSGGGGNGDGGSGDGGSGDGGSGDGGNGDGGNGDGGNGDGGDGDGGDGGTCNCNPGEAPTICAQDGSDGVLIAHENCSKFYICSNGKPVAMRCPGNLLYNPYKQVCDWPENVECGDRIIPDPDENDTGSGGGGNGDGGSGDGGSGDGGNGDGGNGDGGNGDGGNGDGGNGDGGDGDGGDGGTCNCNPGEAPQICAQDGSDGVLIAHENCNKFYICSNGKPVAMRCPGNLLYNPYKQVCDWPENVECGDRVIPDPDENDTGSGGGDNGDGGSGDGGSEDGGNGGGGNGDGGNGDGGNGDGGDGGTCNCNPGEAPTICAQDGSDGVLIAHENCNKFYKCSYGKPVALRCPDNLLYNPYKQVCDWPENVECGDRVIPNPDENDTGDGDCSGDGGNGDGGNEDGGNGDDGNGDGGDGGTCNCNPGEAPTICAQVGSDGVLIAHENCNKFYKCSYGKPVALRCPGNLLYNPYKQVCDWPENVECGDRVIPNPDENDTGSGDGGNGDGGNGDGGNGDGGDGDGGDGGTCNCNPGEAPQICAQDGSDGVLIAHENCNKFYICSNGKPVAMRCPGNLLYNPYKQVCDWPENVECGDRVIPDPDEYDTGSGGGDNGDGDSGDGGSEDGGNGDGGNGDGGNGDDGNGDGGDGGTCNCNPGEAPTICAQDGSDGVLIAHENCNKFYKCSYGKPVALRCPGNLLYNPYKQVCDWPENVECGDRVIPNPDENDTGSGDGGNGDGGNGDGGNGDGGNGDGGDGGTCNCNPGEAPTICAQDGSDGVLIAHENCNKFYKCSYGKPVALRCPGNLLYNPYKQVCDWPENVECGDRVIPNPDENDTGDGDCSGDGCSGDGGNGDGGNGDDGNGDGGDGGTCNCNPGEAPTICAQDGSDGVLIAHENCNKFYKCSYGKPVALRCPGNLLYNPYKQVCDWPENVECGDRVIPNPDENDTGSGDGGNGDGGNGDGGNGDGGNGDDGNGDGGDGGTCNCNPGEAPTICAQDGSDGVLIAHENCNKFYKCSYGKPVALRCPGNLLYNPYKQVCDWPENVECGDRVIPNPDENDTGSGDGGNGDGGNGDGGNGDGGNGDGGDGGTCNCNPGEAPTICAQDGSDGVLIAHENCNKFYKCSYGKPVALRCPGNLLYNPYKQVCDWPENVECGDRVIPNPDENDTGNGDGGNGDGGNGDGGNGDGGDGGTCNCDPGEAPTICAQDGSDGVLIAHEKCNKFYKCSYGKPVALRCPNNLLYNPYKQVCDWPYNVDCGDRVIPDPDENDTGIEDGGNGDGGNGDGVICNCNPGEAPLICSQNGSDGALIAHEKCKQYYICSNGKPVSLRCPGNLLYNPYKQVCDWPENVLCGDRVIPDPDENENDNGHGDDDTEAGTCNCNPEEATSICFQEASDGVLIAHENCDQFYECFGGKPVSMKCSGNLLYNPYTEKCDWPENVNCDARIRPEIENDDSENGACNPVEASKLCSKYSDGTFITHEICNQFYICSSGEAIALTCPGNLLYDPVNKRCEWANNVNCGNRTIPEKIDNENGNDNDQCNCNPAQAFVLCADNSSNGKLIAHENCNQYYMCAHGKPLAFTCPANLLYSPYKETCDWPGNIDCGNRVTSANISLNKHLNKSRLRSIQF